MQLLRIPRDRKASRGDGDESLCPYRIMDCDLIAIHTPRDPSRGEEGHRLRGHNEPLFPVWGQEIPQIRTIPVESP
jgi:hypothetical protein